MYYIFDNELYELFESDIPNTYRKVHYNEKLSLKQNAIMVEPFFETKFDKDYKIYTLVVIDNIWEPFDLNLHHQTKMNEYKAKQAKKEQKLKDKKFYGMFRTLIKENSYDETLRILQGYYPEFFICNICLNEKVRNAKSNH